MRETDTALPGRRGQAARNNLVILDAARHVFLGDPKAPISQVAERAGVGISALYRRYPSKEALLCKICHDGLLMYIGEAEVAAEEPDGWSALTGFLARVVELDVHSLTVHLAGTFTPTPEMGRDARRAGELTKHLVERAHETGRLRADAVAEDIGMILECCAAIRVDDPDRTSELRHRYLALLIEGLSAKGPDLPGPPPRPGEMNGRWRPS
ncbi:MULTISPECIES: helix-turn-helix domain-containing protein [unclassified Amycolatopsis]|uniref:TetR/AcrR family transcriptional regulator n=1 Tax=unclassified Amycolatopsis TaxID=2618356 RepID=UPI0028752ABF|nr:MULTISPECIES: helix-turn-helix domain-containing protein [unclassified Amycolatopsis]MDS0139189.1 helix-turn-helix transcriptional regulator [Amycolatopsis sp. 505]MDS0144421.1 helix-turn-helix transcriptional regulator [Amycolatopsis sp. CM201R]